MPAPVEAPPTLRLPRRVEPVAHRATLRVDPAATTFTGAMEIDVKIVTPAPVIWLHGYQLQVEAATAERGGDSVALTVTPHGEDLLALHAATPLEGAWTLKLRYRGAVEPTGTTGLFHQQEGDAWYAYTQLEATYARRVFPTLDEPDRKTPWTLTLEVPAALTALANTRPVDEQPADAGWKRVRFAPTRPLPSYLIAFAVGPFEIADAGKSRSGVPIRIVATKGKLSHTAITAEVVPQALALLEDYFDQPYPYDKLDFVPIPVTVGFGAMENPGLVTVVSRSMLFDPAKPTPNDRRGIASLAAHELAHQWFGNSLTMAWWDDIWLNEGLATWMEDRIVHAIAPRPDDAFSIADAHGQALWADSLATARAVRQPIAAAGDIENVFDGVSYAKAGAVLAMYERWIGADAFQRGIRAYVKQHADGVVTTADFLAAIGAAAGRDVSGLSSYLDQAGAPHLRVDLRCEAGQPPTLTLRQARYLPPGAATPAVASTPWTIPLCVAHDRDGARGETCGLVREATSELALDAKTCPRWVVPNAGGLGHYRLSMTPALVAQATGYGWSRMSPVERVVLAGEIATMIQAGELDVALGMALVPPLMRDGSRAAVGMAAALAWVRNLVPDARMATYDRWLARTFGPTARKLGWQRKPGEALDVASRRATLVPLVAAAGDRAMVRDAIKLARGWRSLPRDTRGLVLRTAVRADGATYDRILADARAEQDRDTREDLYSALSSTRDPARVTQTLHLLLDDRVDVREVMYLPYGFWRAPERELAERFVRDHLDTLLARFPKDATTGGGAVFASLFTGACEPARRDELAAFVTTRFASLPGGARIVAQAIESMDQCIAWKAQVGPQVERWLATLR